MLGVLVDDLIQQANFLQFPDKAFLQLLLVAHGDVLLYGSGEQGVILKSRGEQSDVILVGILPDVHTVHQNRPLSRVIQAHQQLDKSGFAASVLPDDGNPVSAVQLEIYVFQRISVRFSVPEGNVPEFDGKRPGAVHGLTGNRLHPGNVHIILEILEVHVIGMHIYDLVQNGSHNMRIAGQRRDIERKVAHGDGSPHQHGDHEEISQPDLYDIEQIRQCLAQDKPSPDSGIKSEIRVIMLSHFAQQRGLVGKDADVFRIFMVGNDVGIVARLPLMLDLLVLILLLFLLDAAAHPEGNQREQQIDGHQQDAESVDDVDIADGCN